MLFKELGYDLRRSRASLNTKGPTFGRRGTTIHIGSRRFRILGYRTVTARLSERFFTFRRLSTTTKRAHAREYNLTVVFKTITFESALIVPALGHANRTFASTSTSCIRRFTDDRSVDDRDLTRHMFQLFDRSMFARVFGQVGANFFGLPLGQSNWVFFLSDTMSSLCDVMAIDLGDLCAYSGVQRGFCGDGQGRITIFDGCLERSWFYSRGDFERLYASLRFSFGTSTNQGFRSRRHIYHLFEQVGSVGRPLISARFGLFATILISVQETRGNVRVLLNERQGQP